MQIRSGFLRAATPLRLAVAWGVLLRLWYGFLTPFHVRAHDVDGHVQYIRYMATHWTLPPGNDGAEYWQSPLYYVVAGFFQRLQYALGITEETGLGNIKLLSVAMSIGALLLAVRIARMLLPRDEDRPTLAACAFGVATLPSVVFLSSRISNDVPFAVASLVIAWLLLRWWESRADRDWRMLWCAIGIGILVKLSAFVFAGAALACLLAARAGTKKTVRLLVEGGLIAAALTGWLFALRSLEPSSDRLLSFGNAYLNQLLRVPTSWESFVTFRPWFLVAMPFNHPFLDLTGRQYVLEYLFRSFFFGEFRFADLAGLSIGITAFALVLVPFLCWGILESFRTTRFALPLFVTACAALGSILAYRLLFPLSANQDARFMPALGFFVCFYAALGAYRAPAYLRTFSKASHATLCVLCSVLLILLAWSA